MTPRMPLCMLQAMKRASTERRKYLRFRSRRVYRVRMMAAWLFNMAVFAVCAMNSIVYGRLFGLQRTNDMVLGWLSASLTTWGAIEPVQVLMIVVLPLIIREDSCAGRCFERIRTIYNEFLA